MNNKIIVGLILVVVVGLFYYKPKQHQTNQSNIGKQPEAIQQSPNNSETSTIIIKDFAFSPDTITIKQGSKVTWTNQDTAPHKIKSDTFNSGDLNKGDTFDFTFSEKGSFEYFCSIHPSMKGKIVVE